MRSDSILISWWHEKWPSHLPRKVLHQWERWDARGTIPSSPDGLLCSRHPIVVRLPARIQVACEASRRAGMRVWQDQSGRTGLAELLRSDACVSTWCVSVWMFEAICRSRQLPMNNRNGSVTSKLVQPDNTLIRVKDHSTPLAEEARETQDYQMEISQALLEDARRTQAGRLLLQLLSAVDHAGCGIDAKLRKVKRQPVMLVGWKNRSRTDIGGGKVLSQMVDGFTLFCTVPVRVKSSAPPLYAANLTGKL